MRKNAFTLVELLIVIGIIALIGALVSIASGSARAKSRDTKRIADINNIQKALQLMHGQQGIYPAGTDLLVGIATTATLCGKGNSVAFTADASLANCDTDKIYMNSIVVGTNPYIYNTTDPVATFQLCTTLESGDPKLNLAAGAIQVNENSSAHNVATCP